MRQSARRHFLILCLGNLLVFVGTNIPHWRSNDLVLAAYENFLANPSLGRFADSLLRILKKIEQEMDEAAEAAFEENCQIEEEVEEAALHANAAQEEVSREIEEAAIAATKATEHLHQEMEEAS